MHSWWVKNAESVKDCWILTLVEERRKGEREKEKRRVSKQGSIYVAEGRRASHIEGNESPYCRRNDCGGHHSLECKSGETRKGRNKQEGEETYLSSNKLMYI